MLKIDIYFDGTCVNKKDSRNESTGCGVAVFIDDEYSENFSISFRGDSGTSNIAEWCGCVMAHKIASEIFDLCMEDLEPCKIQIFSDSQLITNQVNGLFAIKESSFLEYYNICRKEIDRVRLKETKWVSRKLNKKADELSKQGLLSEVYYKTLIQIV